QKWNEDVVRRLDREGCPAMAAKASRTAMAVGDRERRRPGFAVVVPCDGVLAGFAAADMAGPDDADAHNPARSTLCGKSHDILRSRIRVRDFSPDPRGRIVAATRGLAVDDDVGRGHPRPLDHRG